MRAAPRQRQTLSPCSDRGHVVLWGWKTAHECKRIVTSQLCGLWGQRVTTWHRTDGLEALWDITWHRLRQAPVA